MKDKAEIKTVKWHQDLNFKISINFSQEKKTTYIFKTNVNVNKKKK